MAGSKRGEKGLMKHRSMIISLLLLVMTSIQYNLCKPDSLPSQPIIVTTYTSQNYPTSIHYQAYTDVGISREFDSDVYRDYYGPMAISLGVMNGSVEVEVTQGERQLLSGIVIGEYTDYVIISASDGYCYLNTDSNGKSLRIQVIKISETPVIAYNLYNNYITDYTASLITYPPSFTLHFAPHSMPNNSGISFLIVAPEYTQPTPLAIWVGEGFYDGVMGKSWWAQIGLNNYDWEDGMNVSYPSWIFSDALGSFGGTDMNYQLVQGATYNFTMALVSDTTWEFLINGTPIQVVSGYYDAASSVSNEGAELCIETMTAWGGSVDVTEPIIIPIVMRFLVDGKWSEPSSFEFEMVEEDWWNGNVTNAPGIDLWGIAGHMQDPNVPERSLFLNHSLPMPMSIPGVGLEPIYGNYSFPQTSMGGGIVNVRKSSNATLQISPVHEPAYISIASYTSPLWNANITSLIGAKITDPTEFIIPMGTIRAVVYAATTSLRNTSSMVINVIPQHKEVTMTISNDSIYMGQSTTISGSVSPAFTVPIPSVPIEYGYVDIIHAEVCAINYTALELGMTVVSPIPLTPSKDDVITYYWYIDTDLDPKTGQQNTYTGSEFTVRAQYGLGYGWRGYVDVCSSVPGGGSCPISIVDDRVSITLNRSQIGNASRFNWEIYAYTSKAFNGSETLLAFDNPESYANQKHDLIYNNSLTFSEFNLYSGDIIIQIVSSDGTMTNTTTIQIVNGQYNLSYMPLKEGTYAVQAIFNGDSLYSVSHSEVASFVVKRISTMVRFSTTPSSVSMDALTHDTTPIAINGTLYGIVGVSVTVHINYTSPSGQIYTAMTTTDENGVFSSIFTPRSEGIWKVKAYYLGDDKYEESSSQIVFWVVTSYTTLTSIIVVILVIAVMGTVILLRVRGKKGHR